MNNISKMRNFMEMILGFAIMLLAALQVSGSDSYLELVGPPPLRFEITAPNNPAFMAALTLPTMSEESIAATTVTNALPAEKPEAKKNGELLVAGNPAGIFGGTVMPPANNVTPAQNPASNLLGINPLMINQYFTPNRPGGGPSGPGPFQPGDSILVPAELGFVPPTPSQSQGGAVYISK